MTLKRPRPATIWTPALVDQLLRLHRAGLSLKAIAKQMGLSHDKVESKAHRLGLSRENPGEPNEELAEMRLQNRKKREYKPKFVGDPKRRLCLGCQDMFHSEWNGNRICKRCKDTAAYRDGTADDYHVIDRRKAGA